MKYLPIIALFISFLVFAAEPFTPAEQAIADMAQAKADGKAVLRVQVPFESYERLAAAVAVIQGNAERNASIKEIEEHAREYLRGQVQSVEQQKRMAAEQQKAVPLTLQ